MSAMIDTAVACLRAGQLVAVPTETVYGLGADALNPTAVARIFALKGRPPTHPLIVHIASAASLDDWARDIPDAARRLAAAFWPGPLTLILKRQPRVPDAVTGGQDSVGLRVPAHPLALALLHSFGGGIAAPSANRYGHVSATRAAHVREEFGSEVDCMLDGGECQVGIESTIVSCLEAIPVVLRPGAITPRMLSEVLDQPVQLPDGHHVVPRAPGSDAAHYAPHTPARLIELAELSEVLDIHPKRAALLHYRALPENLSERLVARRLPADAAGYARELYAALRWADTLGVGQILIESPPANEAWLAVQDRLRRATQAR